MHYSQGCLRRWHSKSSNRPRERNVVIQGLTIARPRFPHTAKLRSLVCYGSIKHTVWSVLRHPANAPKERRQRAALLLNWAWRLRHVVFHAAQHRDAPSISGSASFALAHLPDSCLCPAASAAEAERGTSSSPAKWSLEFRDAANAAAAALASCAGCLPGGASPRLAAPPETEQPAGGGGGPAGSCRGSPGGGFLV